MVYNLTNLTGANNVFEQFIAVNQMTGDILGVFFIICLMFFLIITHKGYPFKQALVGLSIGTITGLFFWMLGLVSYKLILLLLVLEIVTAAMLFLESRAQ